ncbi:chloramphenicol acetyltransferase [Fusobacterium sp.]|uniref:chloramphenicol acetyltransferase n=1 Tax=Fusobacterium sp. TaxID=68766 RepID=UPI00260F21F0|nr:chloramphenicol acetyltransferase [Fusobacterium sp.]
MFNKIDFETWERKEHFNYYTNLVKTNYSLTAELDITLLLEKIKEKNLKFFPTMLFCIIKGVNQNKEFRTDYDNEGNLGYWDYVVPSYTIFHRDDKTFSDIWSEYDENFKIFYKNVIEDIEKYKDVKGIKAKSGRGKNFCPISCLPWLSFTSCADDTYTESKMLFPVITFGKYFEKHKKTFVPISIFINHAVADGYHTCKLINDIQEIINKIETWIEK